MSFFSLQPFEIRLEWGSHAVELLAQDVDCIIIVDVMLFSSCVSLAAGRGTRISPYPWKDASAEAYAAATYRALAPSALRQCSSARELIERGFSADVDLCLAVDADESACRLQGDHFICV